MVPGERGSARAYASLRGRPLNELRDLIEQAVESHYREATRFGEAVAVSLSGGIDSSTVAAFVPHDTPLYTGWYDAEGCDEREYAALVAGDRPWEEIEIVPDDFVAVFDAVAAALGGLRCGPGAIGQYIVAQEMLENGATTTVFTGEGGDELFGGYARQMMAAGLGRPDGYDGYVLPDGYPSDLSRVLSVEWDALRTLCQVDEAIAGTCGLRVVTPLLDPWVVAWTFEQPTFRRFGKPLLREAMRGVVPDKILDRTDKKGFPVPFVQWAQDEPVRSFVEDRIGYVPDPERPYDRTWWYDMLDTARLLRTIR